MVTRRARRGVAFGGAWRLPTHRDAEGSAAHRPVSV